MSDPLDEHYLYLTDRLKVERYRTAIRRLVRPEHTVLDLGCGSGLLGLMALRAGAGTVLFVDEAPVIEMARRTVHEAGLSDRAEFFQARSYELELPRRADIVLCDHVGYFGFDYDILKLLDDARKRFLQAGGVMIPARVDLRLAPIESGSSRSLVQRWRDGSVPDEYAWVAAPAANAKHAVTLQAGDLLAGSARLASLELGAEAAEFLSGQVVFECARDATFDGLAGWFDCVLHEDIRMTNAPAADDRLDRHQAFLPIEEPVAVKAGQRIEAAVMARPQDNLIAWSVHLPGTGRQFKHSTFKGLVLENQLRRMLASGAGG
jgi:protein arginine N-methyltransferase 1